MDFPFPVNHPDDFEAFQPEWEELRGLWYNQGQEMREMKPRGLPHLYRAMKCVWAPITTVGVVSSCQTPIMVKVRQLVEVGRGLTFAQAKVMRQGDRTIEIFPQR